VPEFVDMVVVDKFSNVLRRLIWAFGGLWVWRLWIWKKH